MEEFVGKYLKFSFAKGPILNSTERERWESTLQFKCLPDILFGHNYFVLSLNAARLDSTSAAASSTDRWTEIIRFDSCESLRNVSNSQYPAHFKAPLSSSKCLHYDKLDSLSEAVKSLREDTIELSYAGAWRSTR